MSKKDTEFLFEKESYAIIGAAYDVFNALGPGHKELFYQKALARYFQEHNIPFEKELQAKVCYRGEEVGIYRLDFLVFGKIVVELKKRKYFSQKDIRQVYAYLRAMNLKLGILIHFGQDAVHKKRVVNIR